MSVSVKTNPEKFRQVKVNPEKFKPAEARSEKAKPLKPLKEKPGRPSRVKPPPPTELPPPYPTVPAPVSRIPPSSSEKIYLTTAETTTNPPWLTSTSSSPATSSVVTQPPIWDPLPGPSAQSKLKSAKSASTLLNGRSDDTPGRILAASKSNPTLNKQNLEPPELMSDQPSIASSSVLNTNARLRPERTPPPSSLLNSRPIQPPPQKVKKRGFFAKLFGLGKSKSKVPQEPKPTNKLAKPRPTSFVSASSTARPTPGPTSNSTARPTSVATSNSTQLLPVATLSSDTTPTIRPQDPPMESISEARQGPLFKPTSPRQRAVLLKKPHPVRPTRHGYQAAISARPDRPPLRQNNDSARYSTYSHTAYSQSTNSFASFNPNHATNANYTNYAAPSNNYDHTRYDYSNHNRTTSATHHTDTNGHTYGLNDHPYGINRTQGAATTDDFGYQFPSPALGYILCTVCNTNPQYIDPITGETSPYCTNVCQAAASATSPQKQATCSYPGCMRPAVMYPADHYWNYCSEAHEYSSRKGCIYCRKADENGTRLCAACDEKFKRSAPTIIPVPMDHDAFWHVVDRFTESWAHPTQCPIVRAVYKIALTQHSLDAYFGYRNTLEYYGQFTAQGKRNGNERVLWHGTRRGCNLGEMGKTTPCTAPMCSLCSIIRGSFDIGKFATNIQAGRFGAGIYTSAQASKANDYSSNDKSISTPWKSLLLNNVAAGRECVMYYGDTTLTAPPEGYDSVYGGVGGSLDYDELVVYTSDAIRPTWLVMYNRE